LNPRLIQAAYKKQSATDAASLEDFTPIDFSGQRDDPSTKSYEPARTQSAKHTPVATVAIDEGGDISVPDFAGKTMREVTEACLRLGLDPVLVGSSLATEQTPAAGAKVRRGAKITIQFGSVSGAPVKLQKGPRN
jgi:beta-lactam-binding protein with PASTA domain